MQPYSKERHHGVASDTQQCDKAPRAHSHETAHAHARTRTETHARAHIHASAHRKARARMRAHARTDLRGAHPLDGRISRKAPWAETKPMKGKTPTD